MHKDTPEKQAEHLASSIKQRSSIKDPTSVAFTKTGTSAANIISAIFMDYGIDLNNNLKVLDFGSGSGRVALPLIKSNPNIELTATDVDSEAIDYLSLNIPSHCTAEVAHYSPPALYPDNRFDAIYSISVWSHFPEDLGLEWLREMQRISNKGAILAITIAGRCVLEQQKVKPWIDIPIDDYEQKKFVYKEYNHLHNNEKTYPGIANKGSWGVAAIHPDYVKEKWSEIFEIKEIKACGMNGQQDIVIMKNTKE